MNFLITLLIPPARAAPLPSPKMQATIFASIFMRSATKLKLTTNEPRNLGQECIAFELLLLFVVFRRGFSAEE